jgi:hypothetical protein
MSMIKKSADILTEEKTPAIKSILGLDNYDFKKVFNLESLFETIYIALDTETAIRYEQDTKKYKWDYNGIPSTLPGNVSSSKTIKNITCMKLHPFKYILYGVSFTAGTGISSILTILIDELESQSFISHEKRNYHFIVSLKTTNSTVNIPGIGIIDTTEFDFNPEPFNKGYFHFKTPIKEIRSFSLSIANPFTVVELPFLEKDCYMLYTNPMTVVFYIAHGIYTGNRIAFTNFTTLNPGVAPNAGIIAQVNIQAGHYVTRIDDFTITIPIDPTIIALGDRLSENKLIAYNRSFRNIFPIEFTCIKDRILEL